MAEPDDLDSDGYPTDEALKRIREWKGNFIELMDYVKSIWWMPEWGWHEEEPDVTIGEDSDFTPTKYILKKYSISTGGWSGNEDIIHALEENNIFWSMTWQSSRRGGHYKFEVLETEDLVIKT